MDRAMPDNQDDRPAPPREPTFAGDDQEGNVLYDRKKPPGYALVMFLGLGLLVLAAIVLMLYGTGLVGGASVPASGIQ